MLVYTFLICLWASSSWNKEGEGPNRGPFVLYIQQDYSHTVHSSQESSLLIWKFLRYHKASHGLLMKMWCKCSCSALTKAYEVQYISLSHSWVLQENIKQNVHVCGTLQITTRDILTAITYLFYCSDWRFGKLELSS